MSISPFGVCRLGASRAAAHPGFTTWRARPRASAPAGTSSVMALPAPTYAPSPMVTGATSVLLLPMNAPASMRVGCLCVPS